MFISIMIVWCFVVILMSITWLVYRILDNPTIIDVSWAIVLTMAGLIYLSFGLWTPRDMAVSVVLLAWGLRLALFLGYTRILARIRDKRYLAIAKDWTIPESLGFFLHFQLQGLLQMLVSSSFFVMAHTFTFELTSLTYIGLLIATFGIIGETIADWQLQRFKAKQQGVCTTGLWRYSRHPNYFFELMVWCGFAITTFDDLLGIISVISPLTLWIIMYYITIPITERQSVETRGENFRMYQRQTSLLIPWPQLRQ